MAIGNQRPSNGHRPLRSVTLPKSVVWRSHRLPIGPKLFQSLFDYGDTQLIFEVRGLKSKEFINTEVGNILHFESGTVANYPDPTAQGRRRSKFQFLPKGSDKPEPLVKVENKRAVTNDEEGGHFGNFIAAVRSRKVDSLNADILEGHYSAALCHLANMSYRLGSQVAFDSAKRTLASNAAGFDALTRMEEHLAKEHNINLDVEKLTAGRHLKIDAGKRTIHIVTPRPTNC